jgi:UDP-glucuronate decarboxylase
MTKGSGALKRFFSITTVNMALRSKLPESSTPMVPRMHPADGRVVSNFIVQALRGEPITIYGDGSQTRSFCFVDDLITAFLALMETGPDVTGPVNIGNPGEFTMIELAELVLKLTGSRSKLEFLPLPVDDPKQRRPDISLARQQLIGSRGSRSKKV